MVKQVLDMQDADDVVDIVLKDRDSRVFFMNGHIEDLVESGIDIERNNIGPMGHDFGDRLVVEFEDILDHLLFFGMDTAGLAADIDHHPDFLFRDRPVGLAGVDAAACAGSGWSKTSAA